MHGRAAKEQGWSHFVCCCSPDEGHEVLEGGTEQVVEHVRSLSLPVLENVIGQVEQDQPVVSISCREAADWAWSQCEDHAHFSRVALTLGEAVLPDGHGGLGEGFVVDGPEG